MVSGSAELMLAQSFKANEGFTRRGALQGEESPLQFLQAPADVSTAADLDEPSASDVVDPHGHDAISVSVGETRLGSLRRLSQ
jgi:hypothetical protein